MTMHQELHSLKQRYETLYENSLNLLRTVNCQGIIIECNQTYAKTLGYEKQELIGSSIFDAVPEDSFDLIRESFETWKKTGLVKNKKILLMRKNGTVFPVLESANNLYDENKRLIGSNTILYDMSEINDYKTIIDELKNKDIQKEKFVSMIAHDLKNFIHPINLNCKILKEPKIIGTLNYKQVEVIDDILDYTKKLHVMTSDMLDVHKLEMKKLTFEYKLMLVNFFLENIVRSFDPLIKQMQVKITIKLPPTKIMINSDEGRLFQVFSNLIKNAIDFVPTNRGEIEIGAKRCAKHIVFYLQDNGIGVSAKKQDKLFDDFYQVGDTNNEKHTGSGLGLAICRGIVEGLGGRIWVESKEGIGTTFFFSIPNKRR